MYPNMAFGDIKLPEDATGMHLGLYIDDVLVSVLSLFEKDNKLQFRKFATLAEYQKKGYGGMLLNHVIEYAKQQGYSKIWCNARQNVDGFYKKFGFYETDEKYVRFGLPFVVMELELNK
jgi:GNAT superfamily N-acetyltransferase